MSEPAADFVSKFADPSIDRSTDQARLDLSRRSRTSFFPWRGQFSPELVERLLQDLPAAGLIVDPFVGSGTTLFEACRLGRKAFGAEINPAALSFAVLSELASRPRSDRTEAVRSVARAVRGQQPGPGRGGLFDDVRLGPDVDGPTLAKAVLAELSGDAMAADVFRAALILAMGQTPVVDLTRVRTELRRTDRLLQSLPEPSGRCEAAAADARQLPLGDGVAGSALTSPPYINVFNYHQQYRPAVELLGAGPLTVARAEIGSNRKHRQNRFLTVVQYALDMADALGELHRVLSDGGVATMVVGRESNVRGVAFRNGQLIATLAEGTGAFAVVRWQERRFTTRFGDSIYEDILTLRRASPVIAAAGFASRTVGVELLEQARRGAMAPDVRADLDAAIANADGVARSPLFDPDAIPWRQGRRPPFSPP